MKLYEESAILLDTPLDKLSYVVFDIEATGARPDLGDKMVEIAAFKIEKGFRINRKDIFHSLINPGVDIPQRAVEIHGLSNEKVQSAPDSCSVLYDFFEFAGSSILTAHRSSKDISYMKNELREYQVERDFGYVIDTLKLSRKLYPRQKNNLDAITDRFNIKTSSKYERHRAMFDAESLAVAFCIMMRKVFEDKCYTLSELSEFLRK
jgi:DNA polymerase III epsilon subunit